MGIAQRFPRLVGSPAFGLSTKRHFHRPFRAAFSFVRAPRPQLLKQFAFGLLHLLRGFGVAAHRSDAFQGGDGQALAQILGGMGQRQQRFQRCLIAPVVAAPAAFLSDFDLGLGARAMIVQIGLRCWA